MSGVKHTPGPWEANFSFPGRDGIGDVWQIDADGHAVCTTQFCYAPNTEANARLIAAAPDLLEALKKSAEGWANALELGLIPLQHRDTATILRDEARAAIIRATGPDTAGGA